MNSANDKARQALSDQDVFLNAWQTYRKVLTNNLMFHNEVYGLVRSIITEEIARPFAFLDIACGDALASSKALKGTAVTSYIGIDISEQALDLARETLSGLGCPVVLQNCDFVEVLADWHQEVDVVWIGQSLHHLQTAGKLEMMRMVRRILPDDGIFLIWEPTLLDGEDSAGWIARFDAARPPISVLNDAEWNAMRDHTIAADYQETVGTWIDIGHQAGFVHAELRFRSPSGLANVYAYRP